ncbi:MAG: UDP-N-acetylmuramate--L-alanine ligase [Candidatus Uhrbacteria bacterium]
MNFSAVHSVYLIGIKGVGMTALAQILHARGVRVSGSDVAQRFFTQDVLARAGITFVEGFAAINVPAGVDLIIHSTAYGDDHVEIAEARRRGLTMLTYPEAVALIFNAGKGIAVCGTHGKTTTTAMLGWILAEAGMDPTVIVGSEVPQFGGNARVGLSDLVVLEADEYQDKLQHYMPFGMVLTNVDYDHPDFFPTFEAYTDAFRRFIAKIPPSGFLVACADDPIIPSLVTAARCDILFYGFQNHSPIRANRRMAEPIVWQMIKDGAVWRTGERVGALSLQLPGRHNQLNALGALAAAERLGVSPDVALRALASFRGTRRRFEVIGEVNGVTVIDDYGHHPTEIRVTLAAARERYPGRRILCAFQPHTFTRTIALKDEFATAFRDADLTYIMNIFGSARERHGGVTAAELAAAIAAHNPAVATGGVQETIAALLRDARPGDVIICMGAGENNEVARGLVERFSAAAT